MQIQNLAPAQPVNLVASTLAEIDLLVPLFTEYHSSTSNPRTINILYGIPLPPSQVPRLAHIAKRIGIPGSISVLIDHPAQLEPLATTFYDIAGFPAKVFIKVDTGYHRAGLPPAALNKGGLIETIANYESSAGTSRPRVEFLGLYSHSSLSYNGNTPKDAMDALAGEINGCIQALRECGAAFEALAAAATSSSSSSSSDTPRKAAKKELVISVGASPQIIAVGNLLSSSSSANAQADSASLRAAIAAVADSSSSSSSSTPPNSASSAFTTKLELHAGVYAVRDIQQLATNAVPPGSSSSHSPSSPSSSPSSSFPTITSQLYGIDPPETHAAFSIAAEVCSVYNDHERPEPEALVAVGTLGLGREPCKLYPGWAILGGGGLSAEGAGEGGGKRIMISRISQEHGIAAWLRPTTADKGEEEEETALLPPLPLEVGQVVRVYPNHACIAGAMYGWYLVVDSDEAGDGAGEVVRDVYVRASGW